MPCQHPGKVLLQQFIEPKKLSQNGLARAIKVPPRRINEIIHEKRAISADTATRLAIYFGGSATYWMHLQAEYDLAKVRKNIAIQLSTIQSIVPTEEPKDSAVKPPRIKTNSRNSVKKRIMR